MNRRWNGRLREDQAEANIGQMSGGRDLEGLEGLEGLWYRSVKGTLLLKP